MLYGFALGYLRDDPGKLLEHARLQGHESLDMSADEQPPARPWAGSAQEVTQLSTTD
jgi:hypothetical protein